MKTSLAFTALCLGAALLSGCGKKGQLETPGAETAEIKPGGGVTVDKSPGVDANGKKVKEHKPFVLDGLLR